MKLSNKAINAASYTAGICVIASAALLTVLLILSLLGLIHPRQTRITLHTGNITKTYDGSTVQGIAPTIYFGSLHEGHSLTLLRVPEHSEVGTYTNTPEYVILDDTGADVTNQYAITEDFGSIVIEPIQITLFTPDKSKQYDGEPLTASDIVVWGELVPGESLIVYGVNSITLPGQEPIRPTYAILAQNGHNVTDNYVITERFGTLTVNPIPISISTDSVTAPYTGKSISAPGWEHKSGQLLQGHRIAVTNTTVLDDVGTIPNEATASILDESGTDVTHLYDIQFDFGQLWITPISLTITTESAEKIYDGTDLRCAKWEITDGKLPDDAQLTMTDSAVLNRVGTVYNAMQFRITDASSRDITYRYSIDYHYGSLTVQPRAITLKTGSAKKGFDGSPLQCNEFEVISGSLCGSDTIELICTTLTEPGYCDNSVISCTIYHVGENGLKTDVTACYRITYEYGSLQITTD